MMIKNKEQVQIARNINYPTVIIHNIVSQQSVLDKL